MFNILIFSVFLVMSARCVLTATLEELFSQFMEKYNVTYPTTIERALRFENFKLHMAEAGRMNLLEKCSATYGVTMYADLSPEEFSLNFVNSFVPPHRNYTHIWEIVSCQPEHIATLVDNYDLEVDGYVTPIKNQGMCSIMFTHYSIKFTSWLPLMRCN